MDEQEFLEYIEAYRGDTIERIFGLLSGTNNEDDNLHQILNNFAYKVRGVVLSVDDERLGRPRDQQGHCDEVGCHNPVVVLRAGRYLCSEHHYGDDETLGPCECTDYHMADCPLMTG